MTHKDEFLTAEQDVDQALLRLPAVAAIVQKMDNPTATQVCNEIKLLFIGEAKRVWWHTMKPIVRSVDDRTTTIESELLRACQTPPGSVYFIPDNDNGGPPPVYSGPPNGFDTLLKECSYWEFYVYAPRDGMLIANNDHNEYLVAKVDRTE